MSLSELPAMALAEGRAGAAGGPWMQGKAMPSDPKLAVLTAVGLSLLSAVTAFAATEGSAGVTVSVAEIVLLALSDPGSISLTVSAPAAAGDAPAAPPDSSKYLRYTSLVTLGRSRQVTVACAPTDRFPAGCSLRLQAAVPAGKGTSAGAVVLSGTATPLITGIGGCATGTAAGQGAQLTYQLEVVDTGLLRAGEQTTVTVTFTLTDAS